MIRDIQSPVLLTVTAGAFSGLHVTDWVQLYVGDGHVVLEEATFDGLTTPDLLVYGGGGWSNIEVTLKPGTVRMWACDAVRREAPASQDNVCVCVAAVQRLRRHEPVDGWELPKYPLRVPQHVRRCRC